MPMPGQLMPQHAPALAPAPTPTPTEKKRFVCTIGVPCILETARVGLLAAVAEPPAASAHLRVAEPARTSARDITLGLSAKLCCITRTTTPSSHVVDVSFLTCNLCRRNTNGRTVYVYMSMGFCSRGCREDYHLGELDKNRKRQAVALMGRSKMARIVTRVDAGKAAMEAVGEASCSRPTFFTCAEEAG